MQKLQTTPDPPPARHKLRTMAEKPRTPRIGIDMDGVIADALPKHLALYNAEFTRASRWTIFLGGTSQTSCTRIIAPDSRSIWLPRTSLPICR